MIAVFRRKTVAEVMSAEQGAVTLMALLCSAQSGSVRSMAVSAPTAAAHLSPLCMHMAPLQCCHCPCIDCCTPTAHCLSRAAALLGSWSNKTHQH